MKVLGIIAGRPRHNSEFWMQAALEGAEEAGAEVELINLRNLDLNACTGCGACHRGRFQSGKGACVFEDDMPWLDEQILSCDGMIVCAPCLEQSPPSELKLFCDRLGPSHDVVHLRQAHETLLARGEEGYDLRWFQRRPCAFISHGGSEWTTLGLPILNTIAIPLGMKIVDQLNYSFTNDCVLEDSKIERVRLLGRHVAENCGKTEEEMTYWGDPGHCPICHNRTMVLGDHPEEVTCAVCGITGTLHLSDGRLQVTYTADELKRSHMTDSGKYLHMLDMNMKGKQEMIRPKLRKEEVNARIRMGTGRYPAQTPAQRTEQHTN